MSLLFSAFGIFITFKGLGSCFVFRAYSRWSEELCCLRCFAEPFNLLFCPLSVKWRSVCSARPLSEPCHGKVTNCNPPQALCQVAAATLSAEEPELRAKDINSVGLRKKTRVCCCSSPTGVILEQGNQDSRAAFFPYSYS